MVAIAALPPEKGASLLGVVEADEALVRESRKGSREWARHRVDPIAHPKPPRLRWRDYVKKTATVKSPPGGWKAAAWEKKLLAATDRNGHRAFEAINDASLPVISAALLPIITPDVVLCTDGHATYERMAKDKGITHLAFVKNSRPAKAVQAHHVNTVNALISRFKPFMRPFCGPATKYLTAYERWYAARDNADRDHRSIFKAMLVS